MIVHLDLECKSRIDIGKSGAFRYVQDESYRTLLCSYSVNGEPVQTLDLTVEEGLRQFNQLFGNPMDGYLYRKDVTFVAYNAVFEAACLAKHFGMTIDYDYMSKFRCSMVHAAYLSYPQGLEATGKALGVRQDKAKLRSGRALINLFSVPQKPTKKNGGRKWTRPQDEPEKWETYKEYNKRDVESEMEIASWLDHFPMPESEWDLWRQECVMNANGVRCDREMMEGARYCIAEAEAELDEEARRLTGLDNPNSPTQMLDWLNRKGCALPNLQKATVSEALAGDLPDDVRRALEIRQQTGKTSVKKYDAMHEVICDDDRMRGLTRFYGAGRTGRWAGSLVQLQNLTKHHIGTVDEARKLVREGNYEAIKMLYGNVHDLLSQLVRTAIIPSEGRKFIVADFSAIEARVIAWLAREEWVNEVFATHGKIYEATAAQMFHVPIETIAKGGSNYDLRQKGKVATLALGYQGGTQALITMGALNMGLTEEELPGIVDRWRNANKMTTSLWYELEYAMQDVVLTGIPKRVAKDRIEIALEEDNWQRFMTIKLPSGRKLFYALPTLQENRFGKQAVHYWGLNGVTKKWEEMSTYGGRATENCVQSIARDCLAESLRRLRQKGLVPVFHVHDEVVIDAPMDVTVDEVCDLMSEPIPWAKGLVLKAAGFEGDYYKKD